MANSTPVDQSKLEINKLYNPPGASFKKLKKAILKGLREAVRQFWNLSTFLGKQKSSYETSISAPIE